MSIINAVLTPYFSDWKNEKLVNSGYNLNCFIKKIPITIEINKLNLLAFVLSAFPTLMYLTSLHWFLNNLFGILFTI